MVYVERELPRPVSVAVAIRGVGGGPTASQPTGAVVIGCGQHAVGGPGWSPLAAVGRVTVVDSERPAIEPFRRASRLMARSPWLGQRSRFLSRHGESSMSTVTGTKQAELLKLLETLAPVAVAFSGGVDSAVVAQAAKLACGDRSLAVTAVSPSLAEGELEAAEQLAEQIGIRHQRLYTREFSNPNYLSNPSNRCYFCKTTLYTQMHEILRDLPESYTLVNGTNLDDQGDYRPGLQAATEAAVRSPLLECGITKAEVRELAAAWQLPVWDKPASPCLSSRVAYGLEVTPERLRRVDRAEQFLREVLGIAELRVRYEFHDLARIEVPVAALPRCCEPEVREQIAAHFHELGFRAITLDIEGFRSGNMNALLQLRLS